MIVYISKLSLYEEDIKDIGQSHTKEDSVVS